MLNIKYLLYCFPIYFWSCLNHHPQFLLFFSSFEQLIHFLCAVQCGRILFINSNNTQKSTVFVLHTLWFIFQFVISVKCAQNLLKIHFWHLVSNLSLFLSKLGLELPILYLIHLMIVFTFLIKHFIVKSIKRAKFNLLVLSNQKEKTQMYSIYNNIKVIKATNPQIWASGNNKWWQFSLIPSYL